MFELTTGSISQNNFEDRLLCGWEKHALFMFGDDEIELRGFASYGQSLILKASWANHFFPLPTHPSIQPSFPPPILLSNRLRLTESLLKEPVSQGSEVLGNRDTQTRASTERYPAAREWAGATQEETWRRQHEGGDFGVRTGRVLRQRVEPRRQTWAFERNLLVTRVGSSMRETVSDDVTQPKPLIQPSPRWAWMPWPRSVWGLGVLLLHPHCFFRASVLWLPLKGGSSPT